MPKTKIVEKAKRPKVSFNNNLLHLTNLLTQRYRNITLHSWTVKVHKRVYKKFEEKLNNLEMIAALMGYKIKQNSYPLYQSNGHFLDSIRIEYRIVKSGTDNSGFFLEFKCSPYSKTLERMYSHEIGSQEYKESNRTNYVKSIEDLKVLDYIIDSLR